MYYKVHNQSFLAKQVSSLAGWSTLRRSSWWSSLWWASLGIWMSWWRSSLVGMWASLLSSSSWIIRLLLLHSHEIFLISWRTSMPRWTSVSRWTSHSGWTSWTTRPRSSLTSRWSTRTTRATSHACLSIL